MLFISGGASVSLTGTTLTMFQSRNRDAFHFRRGTRSRSALRSTSFNLVIEMLFISGLHCLVVCVRRLHVFQSRNRDAFHFRSLTKTRALALIRCFNLVIEMLFISGKCFVHVRGSMHASFNLVIEMLFISGTVRLVRDGGQVMFQSRNRDAFHFRTISSMERMNCSEFQSRNRDAFHFR